MTDNRYIAFISYRHMKLDTAVAKRLHRLLEHYRVPLRFRKNGAKRLGKVFRDEDELPISSDLNADIYTALDRSDFLIVICTPETPKSMWVRREIEYFQEHHDGSHILAVLAYGTPEESFPELLTHQRDSADGSMREVEPLAANISGDNVAVVLRKLQNEFIRLAAAILGCPYDALWQREKRYRQKRISALLGGAAVIAAVFAGMLVKKNADIEEQYRHSQKNESYALALLSAQYLKDGDRYAAVESALAALPQGDDDRRPASAAAEYALSNALYAYCDKEMRVDCMIRQDTPIADIVVSSDGSLAVTVDEFGCVRGYDGKNGICKWERVLEEVKGEQGVLFLPENGNMVLCDGFSEMILLNTRTGAEENRIDYKQISSIEKAVSPDGKMIAVYEQYETEGEEEDEKISFYSASTGKILAQTENMEIVDEGTSVSDVCFSPDGSFFAAVIDYYEEDRFEIWVFGTADGKLIGKENYAVQGLFSEEIRIEFCTEEDLFLYWTEYTDIYEKSMEFAIYSCTEMKFTIRNSYNMELVEDDESPLYLMGQDAAVCFYDTCAIYFSFHTGEAKLVHNLPAPVQSAHWKDGRELDFRVVMENGSCGTLNINSLEFRNEYGDSWTSGIDLNYALSGGVLEGEFVFGIPDDDSSSVVILRKTMDKNYTVPISDENGEISSDYTHCWDRIYPFPSGDIILAANLYGDVLWFLDASTFIPKSSAEVPEEYDDISRMEFFGFSDDGQELIFSESVYDMENGIFYRYEDLDEFGGRHMCTAPGSPVISADIDLNSENYDYVLSWWVDGKEKKSTVLPYEGSIYGGDRDDPKNVCLHIGGNGCAVVTLYENIGGDDFSGYAIFSLEKEEWNFIAGICREEESPAVCVGGVRPWFASADPDGCLRIYNTEDGKMEQEIEMDVSAEMIREIRFTEEDRYILLWDDAHTVSVYNTENGKKEGSFHLQGAGEHSEFDVLEESGDEIMYLWDLTGETQGLRISMEEWTQTASIPGMKTYLPETKAIIKSDPESGETRVYPAYTLEDLIKKGRKLTEGKSDT